MSNAQQKALNVHRSKRRASGVVRVEVQVPSIDAQIVRDVAAVLRGKTEAADAMRAKLRSVVAEPRSGSVLDLFGSDLPDEYFEGVFDQRRRDDPPRDLEL